MNANNQSAQISFELKDSQLKSIEQSRQSPSGKLTIKTAVRAGFGNYDCISTYAARNAPFAPENE